MRIIREVEPSTVSRQCHLHHCTYMAPYQRFGLMFDFTFPTLSTSATNSTTATTATTATSSTDWLQIQPLPLSCKSFACQNSCFFQFQRRILDGRRILRTPRLLPKSLQRRKIQKDTYSRQHKFLCGGGLYYRYPLEQMKIHHQVLPFVYPHILCLYPPYFDFSIFQELPFSVKFVTSIKTNNKMVLYS